MPIERLVFVSHGGFLPGVMERPIERGVGPGQTFGRLDFIALGTLWTLMVVRCLVAGRELMWVDELLSFRLINDHSVGHMLHALGDQADGAPPAYYLIARAWQVPFPGSPMWLRMFSTVGFCTGITLLWASMRQVFRFVPTALAVALILGHNKSLAFEALNIRFYGLLFALVCLVAALGFRFCRPERAGSGLLAANALANACLVLCHPLGGFYGAAIAVGVAWSGFASRPRRLRTAVLASYGLGWLAILAWIRQFFRQADINNPHGWIPMPTAASLLVELRSESDVYIALSLAAILFLAALVPARQREEARAEHAPGPAPWRLYLPISVCLVGVTPFFWAVSRLNPSNSIFFHRYLLGTLVGWTIVLAVLLTFVLGRLQDRLAPALCVVITVACVAASRGFWNVPHKMLIGGPSKDERRFLNGDSDRWFGHPELPVVCSSSHDFLPRSHYSADSARYYYLLDWRGATDPRARPGDVGDFKLLSAIRRNAPDMDNIVPAAEFLSRNPSFLVLEIPGSQWITIHLDPHAYTLTRLEPDRPMGDGLEGEWHLVLVEKRTVPPSQ